MKSKKALAAALAGVMALSVPAFAAGPTPRQAHRRDH